MALRVVGQQAFTYTPYLSRTTGANGMLIPVYGAAKQLSGTVHPMPRKLYEQYGLDFQKNYVKVHVSANLIDIARDVAGDKISFGGLNYQCESRTPWFAIDGWNSILCVQIP